MEPVSFGPHVGPTSDYFRVSEQVPRDPDGAWVRLLDITAATDDAGLFWVADILEDFVIHHPALFVPRIEKELETNAKLRRAFVDFTPPLGDAHDRLLDLRERIGEEL